MQPLWGRTDHVGNSCIWKSLDHRNLQLVVAAWTDRFDLDSCNEDFKYFPQ
jgi:hypothetical protein